MSSKKAKSGLRRENGPARFLADNYSLDERQAEQIAKLIDEALAKGIADQQALQSLKNSYSARFSLPSLSNVIILGQYNRLVNAGKIEPNRDFQRLLRKRGVRSRSGICNVTVLTKAFPCPGRCVFCPSEPKMPKSYLSSEPAMMRAVLNRFDPFLQVRNRLQSLQATGHFTDKIDLIISGGTFSFYPKSYQTAFVRGVFNALNHPLSASRSLAAAQLLNETAANRCIGLSLETRPDLITEAELRRMRRLGCTRVEIGVQSLQDEVLAASRRGHGVAEVKRAMRLLKDAAFKVNAHMMPNLPGATPEGDLADMRELFENPDYRPDWLKVYPCMVMPWSELEGIHRRGLYHSYDDATLIELLVEMHRIWPEYVRVTRIYRDIPADFVLSGSKLSNLRQVVERRLQEQGIQPREIRSREIRDLSFAAEDLVMKKLEFAASGGQEFFLSFEDGRQDKLCALLRLRFSSCSLSGKPHFIKELEGAALIREVHTYGEQVAIDRRDRTASQHLGLGRWLLEEAEKISLAAGYRKIAVISGIGVREYYRKMGYRLEGTYMIKNLHRQI